MRFFSWLRAFFPKSRSPEELREEIFDAFRERAANPITRNVPSDCPYGIAADLREDVGRVEAAVSRLVEEGVIRRSATQVLEPDEDGGIPPVYVRYELAAESIR